MAYVLNKLFLMGSVSADAESGTTKNGKDMVKFRMGVRKSFGEGFDNFTVYAYGGLVKACKDIKAKTKVLVIGSVSASGWQSKDGKNMANCNVNLDEIYFLSSKPVRGDADDTNIPEGFVQVEDDNLPF